MTPSAPPPRWTAALRREFGPRAILTSAAALRAHAGDAWHASHPPDAVALPRTTAVVSALLRFCHRRRIPVTTRGAGRGYVGGCVPVHGGLVISLARMNRILEIHPRDFVTVVQPGVITGDLQDRVQQQGLFYPPDPASLRESHIGGNIATNAGGPRCLKYGVTRNYVLGLEVVLADGTIVRTGGRTHKNKLGFNLTDLFIGSEGLLGIVTEATLKLLPLPPARAVVVATFQQTTKAAAAVNDILAAGLLPCALEVADPLTLAAARAYSPHTPPGNAFLLVELDGQRNTVKSEAALVHRILQKSGALKLFLADTPAAADKLWAMRRDFSYALKATGLVKLNQDIVVPRGRLLDVFRLAKRLQTTHGVRVSAFGHAGDGNIHVNVMLRPDQVNGTAGRRAQDELFRSVLAMNGTITGEHGTGLARKPWWKQAAPPALRNLHRTIKSALDPRNILNPGKFLDP